MLPTLALLLTALPAQTTPYDLDLLPHSVATLTAMTSIGVYQAFIEPDLPGGLACTPPLGKTRCSPHGLNELDRLMLGNNSKEWRDLSDIGMYGSVALVLGGIALEAWLSDSDTPYWDFFTDGLVIAEATATAMVITYALKLAIQRPRPNHYTEGAPVGSFSQRLSFPSGHSSTTAAVVTSFATTFWLRHPESPWRFVVCAGAGVIATMTAYARVGGGRHFYTDVLAGMTIGALSGVLVPLWHARGEAGLVISPRVGDGEYGLGVSGRF